VGAPREILLEQQDQPTCTRPTLRATPSSPEQSEVNHKASKHSLIWLIKTEQLTKTKWLAQKTVQKDMCITYTPRNLIHIRIPYHMFCFSCTPKFFRHTVANDKLLKSDHFGIHSSRLHYSTKTHPSAKSPARAAMVARDRQVYTHKDSSISQIGKLDKKKIPGVENTYIHGRPRELLLRDLEH
jgi:hypothetical protein